MKDVQMLALVNASCASAIIEALAIVVERVGSEGLDKIGAEQVRALIYTHRIDHNSVLSDMRS